MTRESTRTPAFSLDFEELVVGFGDVEVAGPLRASWSSGLAWVLTGVNGAGKTTLLRSLIGLHPKIRGTIRGLEGRSISYVPQARELARAAPVNCLEVVGTGLPFAVGRKRREERARAALAHVELEELARRPFARLSGGQQQRVLLARALCADADVVALDEATSGVDAASAAKIWEATRAFAASGKLVIAITHDLVRAARYADRRVVLDAGQLREESAEERRARGGAAS